MALSVVAWGSAFILSIVNGQYLLSAGLVITLYVMWPQLKAYFFQLRDEQP